MSENITPAQSKAIENGGTNNVPVGNSLVKKGLFLDTRETGTEAPFRFVPIATVIEAEKNYAETIEREENETPTSEAAEIALMERAEAQEKDAAIDALRAEFEDADDERREAIVVELFHLGTVVYPEGSAQHTEYASRLRTALAEWKQDGSADPVPAVGIVHIDDVPGQGNTDAEVRFAEAVDADDAQAMREILNETAPAVVVRDPNEKRYAQIEKWTDENLFIKEEILTRRLNRRTLLIADRKQAERHLRTVKDEIAARGL